MGSAGWKNPSVFSRWTRVEMLLEWDRGDTVVLGSRVKKGWTEAVTEGCWGGGRQKVLPSLQRTPPHPLPPDPLSPGSRRKDTGWGTGSAH